MSHPKELNCHEKYRLYKQLINDQKACHRCAPFLCYDFFEDKKMHYELHCKFCKRWYNYKRHAIGPFPPIGQPFENFRIDMEKCNSQNLFYYPDQGSQKKDNCKLKRVTLKGDCPFFGIPEPDLYVRIVE